jgi:hypothetical protein
MSLDVALTGELVTEECTCPNCDNKHTRVETPVYYTSNITHNLGTMAAAAGIYEHLWRPDEIGITKAKDLIAPLVKGLALLKSDPRHFEKYDAPNGWGKYEHFIPFVEEYLEACKNYPESNVSADR